MDSKDFVQLSEDYLRIEKAILFLEENFREQPDLETVARHVNLSKYHFQRLFKRWAGVSPKQFLQFLTIDYAKQMLAESSSILDTSLEAGLSGPSRLHDLFVTFEAITPGEYKAKGQGLRITYGFHTTPFGQCLLATTERGICSLTFVEQNKQKQALENLRNDWPNSEFSENSHHTQILANQIFALARPKNSSSLNLMAWLPILVDPQPHKPWPMPSAEIQSAISSPAIASSGKRASFTTIDGVLPVRKPSLAGKQAEK